MRQKQGYKILPFGIHRRAVAATAAVGRERNTIHTLTEVDITVPRRFMRDYRDRTGERLSLTAYVVACLARTVAKHHIFNAFRTGNSLCILDDVTVGVLVERDVGDESTPDMVTIHAADKKTYLQIHNEIRVAQQPSNAPFGALSGSTWFLQRIPSSLFTLFIRIASRTISIARRYGVVGVTAVGMFGPAPMWIVPLSGATVTVAVGSIVERPVSTDGHIETREHLCLTLSFDHDIIDGAPAARFTKEFAALLRSGEMLHDLAESALNT